MSGLLNHLPLIADQEGWPWTEETDPQVYHSKLDWPKISIVTPSFNQGPFIEQTIRSILLQNYPNLEYIIIDGGSTDETVQIIQKYASYITYWISESDNGQSAAINKGIEKCTGEYFNWINSDDYLEKAALFSLVQDLNKDVDLIAGYCTVFVDSTDEVEMAYTINISESPEDTIINHSMCQPTMFYKTKILKQYCGVDESLHYVMDLALFIRYISEHGIDNIQLIKDNIAYFRKHNLSKTVSIHEKFEYEERMVYAYLLGLCNTEQEKIDFISKETYRPILKWSLNLNIRRVQQLIFKKFLLGKAKQAYAQSDYLNMKKYTDEYLMTKTADWDLSMLKLIIFSNIVSTTLLSYARSIYKCFALKRVK